MKDLQANKDRENQRGASLTEYALLASLIAFACITSVHVLSSALTTKLDTVSEALSGNDPVVPADGGSGAPPSSGPGDPPPASGGGPPPGPSPGAGPTPPSGGGPQS